MRIGVVAYANALPLAHGLEDFLPAAQIVRAAPATIARELEEGRLDVGLVPVAALLSHPRWTAVPGLGIASEGPVRSVLLLARTPITEISRLIADPSSRTSNLLARLWLHHRLGREVEVASGSVLSSERLAAGEATVVIGDDALLYPDEAPHRIDLGGAWTEWTNLPFVFAVWAGPRADAPGLEESFEACYRRNMDRIPELARLAAGGARGRAALLESYLTRSIRYRLRTREQTGLRRFFDLASEAGHLPLSFPGNLHVHSH